MPSYRNSTAYHTRASGDVWNKIKKIYRLDDKDITPTDDTKQQLHTRLGIVYASSDWVERYEKTFGADGLPPEKKAAMEEAGEKIIASYYGAFNVRGLLRNIDWNRIAPAYRSAFNGCDMAENMVDLYLIHMSNRSEKLLQDIGMDKIQAHRINGALIHEACISYNPITGDSKRVAFMRPHVGRTKDKTPEEMDARIERLQTRFPQEINNYINSHASREVQKRSRAKSEFNETFVGT